MYVSAATLYRVRAHGAPAAQQQPASKHHARCAFARGIALARHLALCSGVTALITARISKGVGA